jgi:glyoxylase-like metal-dependent hydrolase (beta-lactamase superfamily II)
VNGVHRAPLPLPADGLRAVNVYLLEDTDGLTMVDAGWALPESIELLESAVRSIGYPMTAVHDILTTHSHRDHYTQGIWLRERYGVRVALGAGERAGLDCLLASRTNIPFESIRQVQRAGATALAAELNATVWPAYDPTSWDQPDRWIHDGDVFGSLTAVATPGHTSGHVVLHDISRSLLFSGDHILSQITPSIGFELAGEPLPLRNYLRSVQLMLKRPDGRLLPAHGPVTPSYHARARELLSHHEQRFEGTLDVLDPVGTASDVAARLLWTRRARPFVELDAFNRMLAICETAAHLDVLVDDGSVIADDRDGIIYYTRRDDARVPPVTQLSQEDCL